MGWEEPGPSDGARGSTIARGPSSGLLMWMILWVRILNVGYGKANRFHRVRRSNEADKRDGKCNRHLGAMIGALRSLGLV